MSKANLFFGFDEDDEDYEEINVKKNDKIKKIKSKTLFDHLKSITENDYDPDYFSNLSEGDKKTFSMYMINRYLSMNSDWISIVNYFQQFTQQITPKEFYAFYSSLIPSQKIFLKYIKRKKEVKYDINLVSLIANYYEISKKEAIEYLFILFSSEDGIRQIKKLCRYYGKDEKEIKKLIKQK